jgi:hypothetical protein
MGLSMLMMMLIMPLSASPASASGTFSGTWAGSYAYVYWADSCDYSGRDFPWWSMNLNFSGGPRAGGKTYIYDMVVANKGAWDLYFPNGITLGTNGVYRVYRPGNIPYGGSQRFIVNTEFPSRNLPASFYPVAESHGCNLTQTLVYY